MSNWEIKTEQINDDYYWGEFGGFRVIVREEDGYINGTKMVAEAGKLFKNWTRNKQTKEYIRVVESAAQIRAADLMETVSSSSAGTVVRGTYVHPDLVIHLAQWCSAEYAYKVTQIVQDYHAREHRREQKRLRKKMAAAREKAAKAEGRWKEEKKRVKKKKEKIGRLETTLEEIKAQNERITALNTKNEREVARLLKMGTRQLDKLDRQEAQLDRQEAQLDDIGTKLGVARHHRVVLTSKDQDRNTLIIMDLHGRLRANRYNRYVIRCKHASAGSAINRVIRDYPQATVLHRIDYSPNSVLLWLRYLEKHGRHLERHGNYFDWKGISTEVGLAYLDAVHSERMQDVE